MVIGKVDFLFTRWISEISQSFKPYCLQFYVLTRGKKKKVIRCKKFVVQKLKNIFFNN